MQIDRHLPSLTAVMPYEHSPLHSWRSSRVPGLAHTSHPPSVARWMDPSPMTLSDAGYVRWVRGNHNHNGSILLERVRGPYNRNRERLRFMWSNCHGGHDIPSPFHPTPIRLPTHTLLLCPSFPSVITMCNFCLKLSFACYGVFDFLSNRASLEAVLTASF